MGCGFCFRSKEELLNHKLESESKICKSDLSTCENCSQSFLTEGGLQMHLIKSNQCMKAREIDDRVSILPFDSKSDNEDISRTERFSDDNDDSHCSEERPIDPDDIRFIIDRSDEPVVSSQPTTLSRSLLSTKRFNKRLKGSAEQGVFSKDFQPSTLKFHTDCTEKGLQLSLDLREIQKNDGLSQTDLDIIQCFHLTKFRDRKISDVLDVLLATFRNNSHLVETLTNVDSQPISNEQLLRFLELHATIDVEEEVSDDDSHCSSDSSLSVYDRVTASQILDGNVTNPSVPDNHTLFDMMMVQESIEKAQAESIFESGEIAKVKLYDILNQANCPKYLFETLQRWASQFGRDLHGSTPTLCKTSIASMGKKVYGERAFKLMSPSTTMLMLPRMSKIPVTRFSIKGAIISLLTNPFLMKDENLLLDKTNPYRRVPKSTVLDDINTGWWYHETSNIMCTDDKDVLFPLLIFIDGSNIDNNGRLSVEPVTLTLGIFNRETRNVAEAWRTIGFIENKSNKVSEDLKQSKQSSAKLQDYHAILDYILKDLKDIQGKTGGFAWNLHLGESQVFSLARCARYLQQQT